MTREAGATLARVAAILAQEMPARTTLVPQALVAALDLMLAPREEWAVPVGVWEETVVALAIVVLRTEGALGVSRVRAVEAVRAALEGMQSDQKAPA